MTGRVLHFGKYDGMDIEEVVTHDPEYIIWAADNVQGSGITQEHVDHAVLSLEYGGDPDDDPELYELDDFADLMVEASPWGRDSE
jgi:hypothetical protein